MLSIVLLLLILVPASGWTATYYVATTGNDSNSCSAAQNIAAPKRTIRLGLSCPGPGDTLYIRGGTYDETLFDGFPGGTSWSSPVTIKAYPGDAAVMLQPTSGVYSVYLGQASEQYIIFDSIIFDGNNKTIGAPAVTGNPGPVGAHHIRFLNCEFRNAGTEVSLSHTHHNEFIGGSIHDNDDTSGLRHGIYIASEASDNIIDGMQIYNNQGYGIHIYNTGSTDSHRNIVRNSVIHDNALCCGQDNLLMTGGDGGLVYNNVVYGGGGGINIGYASSSSNIGVYNNTVTGTGGGRPGLHIEAGSGHVVRNNIVWQNAGGNFVNNTGATADHNLIGTDPLFINAASHDFHLQAGSPAIDTGVAISQIVNDHDGTLKPQGAGYSIGAYRYRSSPTPVIPSPRNLRIAAP